MRIAGGELGINVENPEYMVDIQATMTLTVNQRSNPGSETLTISGAYTGHTGKNVEDATTFRVEVEQKSPNGPSTATLTYFKWKKCVGVNCESSPPWNEEAVPVTGTPQHLMENVFVEFGRINEHTGDEFWLIDAVPTNPFAVRDSTGAITLSVGKDGYLQGYGGAIIAGGLT